MADGRGPATPLQGHCPDGDGRSSAEGARQRPGLQVA